MNRPIEFRVWTGKEMRYHDWFDVINREDFYCRKDDRKETYDEENIMQFTGLLDKNGNKIFEGDLVQGLSYHQRSFFLQVKWIKEKSCFYPFADNFEYDYDNNPYNEKIESTNIKIVSNIYENP